ncbi:MAG TPA: hypothetical protein VK121_01590 [Pseudogracilibacillus sp.]|nr:hypothetical protein [Pseudogracilibacillus sp.]
MKKVAFTIFTSIVMLFSFSTIASAAQQSPNTDIHLGNYDLGNVWNHTTYSNPCTATQKNMTLQVNNTSGKVRYQAQQKAPGGNWSNIQAGMLEGVTTGTENVKINGVQRGNHYRLQLKSTTFSSAKGYVTCF